MDEPRLEEGATRTKGFDGDAARKIGHATLSLMLATSLASALSVPPRTDLMTLPQPTPIVQQYEPPVEEALPVDDEEAPEKESIWRKVLRILKYLLIALLVVGAIMLGALKGCVSCAGPLAAPVQDEQQEDG